jgi:hypothetical protein
LYLLFSLQICESLQSDGWKVEHANPNAMGPYAYKGNQWVGYDDIDIVKLKVRLSLPTRKRETHILG